MEPSKPHDDDEVNDDEHEQMRHDFSKKSFTGKGEQQAGHYYLSIYTSLSLFFIHC